MNDQNLINMYQKFSQLIITQKNIPLKFQQKVHLLYNCIMDQTTSLDPVEYDQLQIDEIKNLAALNNQAKLQMFYSIVQIFMKQTKFVGKLDVLGKSSIIWSEKQIELDLDFKQLKIQRQNKNDQPHVIQLQNYEMTYGGYHLSRYQIILTNKIEPKSDFQKISLGSEDKEDINQWWEQLQKCCLPDKQPQKTEQARQQKQRTMTMSVISPSNNNNARKMSEEEQFQPRSEIRKKNQTMVPGSEKQFDIEQFKKPIQVPAKQVKIDVPQPVQQEPVKQLITPPIKQEAAKEIIKEVKEVKQKKLKTSQTIVKQKQQFVQLPAIFEDLKDRLNYFYLADEEGYDLIQFDSARIMQSQKNKNHYKLFISLPKVPLEILIMALYDPFMQSKWNRQIKKSQIIAQPSSTMSSIDEVRVPLNSFYSARQFQYLRYIHAEQDQFFLIDKTFDHNHKIGNIEWQISGIFVKNNECRLMVVDTLTYNNGLITANQDQQLLLTYLKQYANLKLFLKEERRKNFIANVNLPIFVSEVMKQFESFQQQQEVNVQQQVEAIIELEEDEDEEEESHEQIEKIKQEELTTIIPQKVQEPPPQEQFQFPPVQQIDQMDSEQEQESVSNFSETYEEFLKRSLMDIYRKKHYQTQIHNYDLEPIKSVNNQRFDKTEDGKHFFFRDDWVYDKNKGILKFVNQKKLDDQKKVFKYMISKMGSNLMSGKSIMSVSLPVYVFEKRSNLERFAASFAYAPHFFEQAADKDPITQMKAVVCYAISTTLAYLTLEKPFNPILGETYQGWIKGCPVYVEQISHHPPIAAFQLYGRGYKIHGHFETVASMGPNTMYGGNVGCANIDFDNGTKFQYIQAKGCIGGIAIGDRTFYLEGQCWVVESQTCLVADLTFNPSTGMFGKKNAIDHFEGSIYRVDHNEITKWQKEGYRKYNGIKGKIHNFQTVAMLDGNYCSYGNNIKIDGNLAFNVMVEFPFLLQNEKNPLASDCQYREDIVAWKMENFDLAMENKEKLEILQRNDRKFRAQFAKTK